MSNAALQEEMFIEGGWFPSELKLMEMPDDATTSEWVEGRVVVIKSSKLGPWRNDNNPPLVGIMNIPDRRGVFKNTNFMSIMKGVQTGVSVGARNIVYRKMSKSAQTALYVLENEKKSTRICKQHIQQTIRKSPDLAKLLSDNPDDTNNYSIILQTGFTLNMGWGGSHASVSSEACETVVIDELDRFEKAMNIEEAKDRITTFARSGFVLVLSTSGIKGGPIDAATDACDTIMDYHVKCPDCDFSQIMDFEHFWWPGKDESLKDDKAKKRLGNKILRERSARYVCAGCGVLWNDFARDKAVRSGLDENWYGWKMREEIQLPVSIGMKFPSWISPFKSLSTIVARWIKAQVVEGPGLLRAWHNQEAAEAYTEKHSDRTTDSILALRDDRPRGLVPKDIATLILSVDTQKRGFYYNVFAFGFGTSLPVAVVDSGYVETFEAVKDLLYNSEYKDIDGKEHVIPVGFIDSGGGTGKVPKHSRTAEVYDFCRLNPAMKPIKGFQRMTTPWATTHLDYYPGTKTRIPGGLTLYRINVTYFKDSLSRKLNINPEDPGAWRLHSECTEEYARHMVAEYSKDGIWLCPPSKPNHFWDVGVYGLAGADIMRIKFWPRPEEEAAANQSRKKPKRKTKRGRW